MTTTEATPNTTLAPEMIEAVLNPTQENPLVHDWPDTSSNPGARRIWIEYGKRGKGKDKMRLVYQPGKTGHPDGTLWRTAKPDPLWHDFIVVYKPVDAPFGITVFDVYSTIAEMEAFKATWYERLDKQQQKDWNKVQFRCTVKNGQAAEISLLF